jgi:hypothetical protein
MNINLFVNELRFLLVTHIAYSDARIDSYGILKLRQGAEHYPDRLDIQMTDQVLRA